MSDLDRREQDRDGDTTVFPVVRNAQGGPSPDGKALLVEGLTAEGGVVRFALSVGDVQHFIAFLLISVAKISATRPDWDAPLMDVANCRPIPATSIAIGEPQGEEGYISVAVGGAELVFAIPASFFDPIGRTMLTASVQPGAGPTA
ncbi:MAG: hypothetical protein JO128_19815 [Alphaproteobacteria bacterium]|nr:hypothetical protein [Alphaproteobacteria bacterium]